MVQADTQQPTILIVDDEMDLRYMHDGISHRRVTAVSEITG